MSVKLSVKNNSSATLKIPGGTQHTGGFDYNLATNKPQINGVELTGNLTSADLNISTGSFDYEQSTNKPQIEGVELSGNRTFQQLGMSAMSVPEIEKILYLGT